MRVDDRMVLGISVWIKPLKFAVSIAIYLYTLGWLLGELPATVRGKRFVRWGAVVAMIVEITCIAGQSARGVASHFNEATLLDSMVFNVMGLTILFNTVLELIVLRMFFRPGLGLTPAYLWGIRLGLASALVSAGTGLLMIIHGGHSVGGVDGGPGLWLVNWSTEHGDLRPAHAASLHALQILPAVGYVLSRTARPTTALVGTLGIAILYAGLTAWLLIAAIAGQPMLRMAAGEGAISPSWRRFEMRTAAAKCESAAGLPPRPAWPCTCHRPPGCFCRESRILCRAS
jgi:hypothetical protein